MGTRAIIRVDGKVMFATHWDGYPESLGKDLAEIPRFRLNPIEIARIADNHTIDSVDKLALKKLNKRKLNRMGDIKNYGDFAEFEYDVNTKTGKIIVRESFGEWHKSKKGKWKTLKDSEAVAKAKLKKLA